MDTICKIPKTTVEKDFLDNFHLVTEKKNGKQSLKFFCPLIDANEFNYEGMIVSLRDAAGHYCLSRRTWDENVKRTMQLSHLVREKFRELDQNKGELAELLLFSFLETDLKAPKILTKMELKTNPNMYFNGADGVHYLKLSNGDYQLIFGESKAFNNLGDGISAALDSIRDFKNNEIKDDISGTVKGIEFEKGLLSACIANETYSEEERDLLKSLIYPKASNHFAVDTAFAVFVLFNFGIDSNMKKLSNQEFRDQLFNKIRIMVDDLMPSISQKINSRNLMGHSLYFYLLPLHEMELQRAKILGKVVE